MPAVNIQRSIEIDASPNEVFDLVADFNHWDAWSPWLRIDPQANVEISEVSDNVGSMYHWKGSVTGEGKMTHRLLRRPHVEAGQAGTSGRIESDLHFIAPQSSHAKISFDITPSSQVTWTMDTKLPWFLFWLKPMIETFVGMDYDRGLLMIKELAETGSVASRLEVLGVSEQPARHLVGRRDGCSMDDIGPRMEKLLDELLPQIDAACDTESTHNIAEHRQEIASFYLQTSDLRKQWFDYQAGRLFSTEAVARTIAQKTNEMTSPDQSSYGEVSGSVAPAGRCLVVRHIGRYENLGNAWSGAIQYARYRKHKLAKRVGYEIYRNDPNETPPEELITDVYLPVR